VPLERRDTALAGDALTVGQGAELVGLAHRLTPVAGRAQVRRYEAPLRSRIAPLTNSASGEARNRTAAATSSGRATRPHGLCARMPAPSGPSTNSAPLSVPAKR